MSVPANEMGSVGSSSPSSVATPTTGTANPSGWTQALSIATAGTPFASLVNTLTGGGVVAAGSGSTLGNYALIAVGSILILGALLISQKQTVVQLARTSA